ncbi:MAG: adenosine kinase [Porticoccaceae bacterium]
MNRKYHVFAMGAALVDTEIEVADADLDNLAVDKGLMTLVDEARQAEVLDYLKDHLTASRRASGGSAANTIIAVSAFGARAFFCGRVANDENGQFYLNDLSEAGVEFSTPDTLPEGTTGKCLVLITPDAERSMNTFLGISETLSDADLNLDALAASEYIYIEGYLATSESGRAAAISARKHAQANGVKVAISLSDPGIVRNFRKELGDIIGNKIDMLFCNRDEALLWTGADNLKDASEEMSQHAEHYAITLGADGALVHNGSELFTIPGRAITAIDTNGAGDMFAGAFLYGLSQGMTFKRSGELGCLAAAAVVGQFGPRLPLSQYRGIIDSLS